MRLSTFRRFFSILEIKFDDAGEPSGHPQPLPIISPFKHDDMII